MNRWTELVFQNQMCPMDISQSFIENVSQEKIANAVSEQTDTCPPRSK